MYLRIILFNVLICTSIIYGDLVKSTECTKAGPMCDDCKTLVNCFKDENGDWDKELIEYCEYGKRCLKGSEDTCSFSANDDCDMNVVDYRFRCQQSGIFPHPFDCKTYYNCLLDEDEQVIEDPIEMKCTNGFGYDPLTTRCRQPLIHGDCRRKLLEACFASGGRRPIEGTTHLYAVCTTDTVNDTVTYFPQIHTCKGSEEYVSGSCTAPEDGLDNSGRCNRLGFFYDPLDCSKYNECLFLGFSPTSRSCLSGYSFNKFSHVCESKKCQLK